MKNEAIAIQRISSDGQSMGHSLDAQLVSAEKAAEELNVEIVKTWRGVQTSKKGKNFGRRDLEEMLNYCKQNRRVKYVLVDMVNRLMREVKVMVYYIVRFEEMNVKVHFCDPSQQHLNRDDQMSQLMLLIEGFSAEQDNTARRNTTIARMKARYQAGYYLSHPHAGYLKSEVPGIHIPDPERFPLLQKAGRLIIYKQYTPAQAVKWLNAKGYVTRHGKDMDLNHYVEQFEDSYYYGNIDIKSEGWAKGVKGRHQPMFTQGEHNLLVSVFRKRNPRLRLRHNPEFPMANMVRHHGCKDIGKYEKFCGYWFNRGKRKNGKARRTIAVYGCRDCKHRIRREVVHKAFSEYLNELTLQPSEQSFKAALKRVWKLQRGNKEHQLRVLNIKLADIETKVKETAVALASESNETAKKALRSLLDDYDKRINQVKNEISETRNSDIESEDFVKFAIDFVTNLRLKWWQLSYDNRKRGEQILFNDKIYIDNSAKVHTPSLSTIYRLGTNKKALSELDNAHLVEHLEKSSPLLFEEIRRWRYLLWDDYIDF